MPHCWRGAAFSEPLSLLQIASMASEHHGETMEDPTSGKGSRSLHGCMSKTTSPFSLRVVKVSASDVLTNDRPAPPTFQDHPFSLVDRVSQWISGWSGRVKLAPGIVSIYYDHLAHSATSLPWYSQNSDWGWQMSMFPRVGFYTGGSWVLFQKRCGLDCGPSP